MSEVCRYSHTFLVHFWQESLGQGKIEWRGQLKSAGEDQIHYFRDWERLNTLLRTLLRSPNQDTDRSNHSQA